MQSYEEGSPPRGQRSGDAGFLLAIDFGGTKIAMAATATDGERLAEREIPTQADEGAARVMQRMFDVARDLIRETAERHGGALRAVAAVTPGIIEPGGIRLAPNNPGWETLALADVLRDGFDIDNVVVETDVKAAALAEARCGSLSGVECGIYLNLGTGLASAAVIDGRVLRGAHGAAGEIGYQLRGTADDVLFADGGASLEQFVSGRALQDRVGALLGREVSAGKVFALAETDARVAALVDDALHVLGVHVANMALTLDPARIAIGGGMARVPRIVRDLATFLQRALPYPPEVTVATFGHDAALQGAILYGVDACRMRVRTPQRDARPENAHA
ncbi:ROK family protein [Paraburkholderia sp. GAS334]|uniref:ROK family protein n=1 Tax=Paraburkholderia sp. GAS334 TaxID=3035131 RepID=UPI003D231A9C